MELRLENKLEVQATCVEGGKKVRVLMIGKGLVLNILNSLVLGGKHRS